MSTTNWLAMIGDCDKCGKHGEVYAGEHDEEVLCGDCHAKQQRLKVRVQIDCLGLSDLLLLPDGALAEAILNVCRETAPLDSASIKTKEVFSDREILVVVSRSQT